MCGIAGVYLAPKVRTESEFKLIRWKFQELLVEMDSRGGDGCGVATITRKGGVKRYRNNILAYEAIFDKNFQEVVDSIGSDTAAVIGHTRLGTVGNMKDIEDYHPFICGTVVGVHNGMFFNDKEVVEEFSLEREGVCDSEALFRLTEKMIGNRPLNKSYINLVLEQFDGSYAVVIADTRRPTDLYLLAGSNPLVVLYDKNLEVLFYASTEQALKNVTRLFERLTRDFADVKMATLPEYRGYRIDRKGMVRIRNLSKKKPLLSAFYNFEIPMTDFGTYGYAGKYNLKYGWDWEDVNGNNFTFNPEPKKGRKAK